MQWWSIVQRCCGPSAAAWHPRANDPKCELYALAKVEAQVHGSFLGGKYPPSYNTSAGSASPEAGSYCASGTGSATGAVAATASQPSSAAPPALALSSAPPAAAYVPLPAPPAPVPPPFGGAFGSAPAAGLSPQSELFQFWDDFEGTRPVPDYWAYPHGDVPDDAFPENSWQTDAVYVNHFLDASLNLVGATKDAIEQEYAGAKDLFKIWIAKEDELKNPKAAKPGFYNAFTTARSYEGLARRMLHALMTNDEFTVVLGGHSAAVGHGNNFWQSYTIQMHEVLEPVFKRLGITLVSRNAAMGGMGTDQSTYCGPIKYGQNVDVILWDSSMTEREFGLFFQTQTMSGSRPPFLAPFSAAYEPQMHFYASVWGADVGGFHASAGPMIATESEEQAERDIPYAMRYMKCAPHVNLCGDTRNPRKYNAVCWVDRPDVTPPKTQGAAPGSQVSWHPGWRSHRFRGRLLAYFFLSAMEDALQTFQRYVTEHGTPLTGELWHVKGKYAAIRARARANVTGGCIRGIGANYRGVDVETRKRWCGYAWRCATHFTPRAVEAGGIANLLVDKAGVLLTERLDADAQRKFGILPPEPFYYGPDVPVPEQALPEGALDVLRVANGGGAAASRALQAEWWHRSASLAPTSESREARVLKVHADRFAARIQRDDWWNPSSRRLDANESDIQQLLEGVKVTGRPPGHCDGTYRPGHYCGRGENSSCMMIGHSDGRGMVQIAKSASFLLRGVKNGFVGIRTVLKGSEKLSLWHAGLRKHSDGQPAPGYGPDGKKAIRGCTPGCANACKKGMCFAYQLLLDKYDAARNGETDGYEGEDYVLTVENDPTAQDRVNIWHIYYS